MSRTWLRVLVPFALVLLLTTAVPSSTRGAASSTDPDLGYLTMNYEKVPWPTPESLLQGLRSKNYETSDRALRLIGVPQTPEAASFEPPQEAELRYAQLGEDGTQQAIVGVRRDAMLYGAVAAQAGGGWRRIAAFSCWCKYESGDLLGGFVHIQAAPGAGQELVLRASGGGTGVYAQQQAHFRYVAGELRLVFTFVSRSRNCDPTQRAPYTCEVQRRWFYVKYWDTVPGAVLVESHMRIFPDSDPAPELTDIRELELTHAQKFSCKAYKWNSAKFRYESFNTPNSCRPQTAK